MAVQETAYVPGKTLSLQRQSPIGAKKPTLDNKLFSMNSSAQNSPSGLDKSKI
jgi:hypothetical protein